jgi:PPOX class probable F420-dependent enzyme
VEVLDPIDPKHAEVAERLRVGLVVWLTTVTPEGQPQATPVWYHWDGGTFLVYSQPGRPKLANIAANQRVSLHPVGAEDAEDAVTIEGTAALDPSTSPADQIPAYITKYLELIDGFGWTPASFAADYSVAVRVTPTRFRIL